MVERCIHRLSLLEHAVQGSYLRELWTIRGRDIEPFAPKEHPIHILPPNIPPLADTG